jgi:hypothetical protein
MARALHQLAFTRNINRQLKGDKTTDVFHRNPSESQMNESKPADALFILLRSSLSASGEQAFGHLVLYTSFGVVRGRIGLTFAQGLINKESIGPESEVIEINDVTVEHYSNHLANATFDRLYVRLSDVRSFALVGSQG